MNMCTFEHSSFGMQWRRATTRLRRSGRFHCSFLCSSSQSAAVKELLQEKARKTRNAAAVLFGLKFADNIDHKFKSSQASKARLQSSKHTGAKQKLTQNGHHVIIFTFEEISNSSTRIIRAQLYRSNCGKCDTLNVLSRRVV